MAKTPLAVFEGKAYKPDGFSRKPQKQRIKKMEQQEQEIVSEKIEKVFTDEQQQEQEIISEKSKKVFTDEQIKYLLDDDFLKPFAMKYLVDNADELNAKLTALNSTIDEKIMTSFFEKIESLKEQWEKIPDEIKKLPLDIKGEIQSLHDGMEQIYSEFDKKINGSEIKIDTINAMALDTVSKAMLNSSHSFAHQLNDSKEKMIEATQKEMKKHLKEISEEAIKQINESANKKNPILIGLFGFTTLTSVISCLILLWLTFS